MHVINEVIHPIFVNLNIPICNAITLVVPSLFSLISEKTYGSISLTCTINPIFMLNIDQLNMNSA